MHLATSSRPASLIRILMGIFGKREPCFVLQLPIEDLGSLTSRSLRSSFTATVPASTEDVLLKGFQMLDIENDKIETAQQVFETSNSQRIEQIVHDDSYLFFMRLGNFSPFLMDKGFHFCIVG